MTEPTSERLQEAMDKFGYTEQEPVSPSIFSEPRR
jgi:hypothetical protein